MKCQAKKFHKCSTTLIVKLVSACRFTSGSSMSYAETERSCSSVCRSCRAGIVKWSQSSPSRCFCADFTTV